jgi:hypothetical protein
MRICDIDGCERKHYGKGYCRLHYKRFKRHGDAKKEPFDIVDIKAKLLNKAMPIPECGCLIWNRSNRNGYGLLNFKGKATSAHRVSWIVHYGPIPEGLCVLHKCDTPACINPHHLFLGTHQDNMSDCIKKGRHPSCR